jgi:DNA (cytosine-5)-methyltransferase 1
MCKTSFFFYASHFFIHVSFRNQKNAFKDCSMVNHLISLENLDETQLMQLMSDVCERLKTLKLSSESKPIFSPQPSPSAQSEKNFIDLFCGAGGLSCGLEMAGWNCVLGVDSDKKAMATFARNHPHSKVFDESIAKLTKSKLLELITGKEIDLVAGGPPCQGFSTFGEGNPDDEKNQLFKEYCRVIEIVRPKFILFENVTGILAQKNEKVIQKIFKRFRELGYEIKIQILESQHYGVPQKRRRAIILGTNTGVKITYPTPSYDIKNELGVYIPPKTLEDALASVSGIEKGEEDKHNHVVAIEKLDKVFKQRLECIPEGRGIRYQKDEDELLPGHLKLGVDWKKVREGRLREVHYYKLSRKLPAPTINTQNIHYFHPVENRRFTLRELASIQSFPFDFIFEGGIRSINRQIGNAVPPLLGKALGIAVNNMLAQIGQEKVMTLTTGSKKSQRLAATSAISEVRKNAFIYRKDQIEKLTSWRKTQEMT